MFSTFFDDKSSQNDISSIIFQQKKKDSNILQIYRHVSINAFFVYQFSQNEPVAELLIVASFALSKSHAVSSMNELKLKLEIYMFDGCFFFSLMHMKEIFDNLSMVSIRSHN